MTGGVASAKKPPDKRTSRAALEAAATMEGSLDGHGNQHIAAVDAKVQRDGQRQAVTADDVLTEPIRHCRIQVTAAAPGGPWTPRRANPLPVMMSRRWFMGFL